MQIFYAPNIVLPMHTLSEEESKHCVRVLRLSKGDELHLTDGKGTLYRCVIEDDNPKRCTVNIIDTIEEFEKRPYQLTMAVAPTKNSDRFEWFLEKATEVGIDRIIPIVCEHSERRVLNKMRCERVVASAVKQSLKAYFPKIDDLTPIKEVLNMEFEGNKYIAHCEKDYPRVFLGDIILPKENSLILIGPEGDFSPSEITLARTNGFQEITLGASRLRTETAAITATVITSFINTKKP